MRIIINEINIKKPKTHKSLTDVKIPYLTWVVPIANKMNMVHWASHDLVLPHPLASNSSNSHPIWLELRLVSFLMPKLFFNTFVNGVLQNALPLITHPHFNFWNIPSLWNIPWSIPSKVNYVIHWSTVNKNTLNIFHVSGKVSGAGDTVINKTDPDATPVELTVQWRRKIWFILIKSPRKLQCRKGNRGKYQNWMQTDQ